MISVISIAVELLSSRLGEDAGQWVAIFLGGHIVNSKLAPLILKILSLFSGTSTFGSKAHLNHNPSTFFERRRGADQGYAPSWNPTHNKIANASSQDTNRKIQ